MDSEIKRLLKLSSIPGFRLSYGEQATLDAWKAEQERVVPKRTRRKKTVKVEEPAEEVKNEIEKVQNVITPEDLTLNEVES